MSVLNVQKAIQNEMARLALSRPAGTVEPGDRIEFGRANLDAQVTLHGFGAPEGGGRWTLGSTAGFVFHLGAARHAVMELEVRPFVRRGAAPSMRLQCGDGPVHEFSFTPGDDSVVTLAIPIEHRTESALLRVRIDLPALDANSAGEIRRDRRSLGVFIRSMRIRKLEALELGQRIALGADDERFLALSSFGQAEPTGRWTLGKTAALYFRPSHGASSHARMFLELTALVTAGRGQTLVIQIDAGAEHEFHFPAGRGRRAEISFPVHPQNGNSLTRVIFKLRHPQSPNALGLGEDQRPLGVQVHEIRIERESWWASWRGNRARFVRRPSSTGKDNVS